MEIKCLRPMTLPVGSKVVADFVRHPVGGALGTFVRLRSGVVVWADSWGVMRSLPRKNRRDHGELC